MVRVLERKDNQCLIMPMNEKKLPYWVDKTNLNDFQLATPQVESPSDLSVKESCIIQQRYTMIADIVEVIGDKKKRAALIKKVAQEYGVSEMTIRNYIISYLQGGKTALISKTKQRELTDDEKNIRWALNKYYYNAYKHSLVFAYRQMIKERYTKDGIVVDQHPTYDQFRYYYRKHHKSQNEIISREGMSYYQRNKRPLLKEGIQQMANTVGTGLLDSTICDIYLVNDEGKLVGRPVLTACVDAYSGLLCGYSLDWQGGMYSIRNLMLNVIADKKAYCKQFGISIKKKDWDCSKLPAKLITDKGSEYKGQNFEQLTDLGITITNLQAFRPDQKSKVEKFFDVVQGYYKELLKGKGVVEKDINERTAPDYRRMACLTMKEFETILLHCIIFYNKNRILEFPYTDELLAKGIKPYPNAVWNYKLANGNLIDVSKEKLVQVLLPRTTGKFTKRGLIVNGMRYKNEVYREAFLNGGSVIVCYNPDNVNQVWLADGYVAFELIESRYADKSFKDVEQMQKDIKELIEAEQEENLQAYIDLMDSIESIASVAKNKRTVHLDAQAIKKVRSTRQAEKKKEHKDIMEGVK